MLKIKGKILFSFYQKLLPLIILLIVVSSSLQAQEEGRARISLIAERGQYDELGRITQNYGFHLEYYVTDYISLGYQFSIGQAGLEKTDSTNAYGHITMGSYASTFPFRTFIETEDEFYLYLAIFAILLPESIHFHLRVSEGFHISPYIAPFGMEYELVDERDIFQASFAAGLRLNVFIGDVSFAPFAAVRNTWNGRSGWGYVGGFMLGISP